jgi:hypothetical protein
MSAGLFRVSRKGEAREARAFAAVHAMERDRYGVLVLFIDIL